MLRCEQTSKSPAASPSQAHTSSIQINCSLPFVNVKGTAFTNMVRYHETTFINTQMNSMRYFQHIAQNQLRILIKADMYRAVFTQSSFDAAAGPQIAREKDRIGKKNKDQSERAAESNVICKYTVASIKNRLCFLSEQFRFVRTFQTEIRCCAFHVAASCKIWAYYKFSLFQKQN